MNEVSEDPESHFVHVPVDSTEALATGSSEKQNHSKCSTSEEIKVESG